MKEYTLIMQRTLTNPEIIIMFRGTMEACQYYVVCHSGQFELLHEETNK